MAVLIYCLLAVIHNSVRCLRYDIFVDQNLIVLHA